MSQHQHVEQHICKDCNYKTIKKANLIRHILLKHSTDKKHYNCDWCDSTFTTIWSMKRHMSNNCINKPTVGNVNLEVGNVNLEVGNVNLEVGNVNLEVGNVNLDFPNVNPTLCKKCNKQLSTPYWCKVHEEKCKGTMNSLECHICHKVLSCTAAKSRHIKICKGEQPLIPYPESITNQPIHTQTNNIQNNIQNNNTQNNIQNNNTTQNNNNINIVVFNPFDKQNHMPFNIEHISEKVLQALSQSQQEKDMVSQYTRHLLENPANKCIRKTNMRSSHSSIHIGDNKWQTHHDTELYPKLVADVSNRLSEHIHLEKNKVHIQKKTYNRIIQFLECFADYGYCADKELEYQIPKDFRNLVNRAKTIVFDITKEVNEQDLEIADE